VIFCPDIKSQAGFATKDQLSSKFLRIDFVSPDWYTVLSLFGTNYLKKTMVKTKKNLYRNPHISISKCDYGHGVFATKTIPADATLEECPYLRIRADECAGSLDDYVFSLETAEENGDEDVYSLVLGWGSLFNHSYRHNTEYWHDTDRDLIVFHTIKKVVAGSQLFVNYGKEWWKSRDLTPK
jgi:hypothetical protein